jgi:hypothetical protein
MKSTQRSIAIILALFSTALFVVGVTSCGSGDIVYHSCVPKDAGADGAGGDGDGSGGNCP